MGGSDEGVGSTGEWKMGWETGGVEAGVEGGVGRDEFGVGKGPRVV